MRPAGFSLEPCGADVGSVHPAGLLLRVAVDEDVGVIGVGDQWAMRTAPLGEVPQVLFLVVCHANN